MANAAAVLIANSRAAWWATLSIRRARRVGAGVAGPTALPRVPNLPSGAQRGVTFVLRLAGASCLVRATVLQAWYLAHGDARDLVIGVTAPSAGFAAHAWLEGDPPCHRDGFQELLRQPARR